MLSPLAGILRLASLALCLVVTASFVLFVVNRTSSASRHQQQELSGEPAASGGSGPATEGAASSGSLRHTIDEVAKAVTSPFSGVTSGSSSQWVIRGVGLLLALLVYGVGLGFLVRVLRLRL